MHIQGSDEFKWSLPLAKSHQGWRRIPQVEWNLDTRGSPARLKGNWLLIGIQSQVWHQRKPRIIQSKISCERLFTNPWYQLHQNVCTYHKIQLHLNPPSCNGITWGHGAQPEGGTAWGTAGAQHGSACGRHSWGTEHGTVREEHGTVRGTVRHSVAQSWPLVTLRNLFLVLSCVIRYINPASCL